MIKLKEILQEAVSIDGVDFSIHSHVSNTNGPANLITFMPKNKSDERKLNKQSSKNELFAIRNELAKIYTKKTGIKFIAYENWMTPANQYSIQIDMEAFIKKFIL
jgi:hypothetical protein